MATPTPDHFIHALPYELLPPIFSHLDPRDLKSSALTCSQWNELVNQSSTWKSPFFRRFGDFRSDIAAVLVEGLHWKMLYKERQRLIKETENDVEKIRALVKEKATRPRNPDLILWAFLFEGYSGLKIEKPGPGTFFWRHLTKEWVAPNIYFLDLVDLGVALCQSNLARKAEFVLKKALDFSSRVDSAVLMNINNLACAVLMMGTLPNLKVEKREQYFSQAEELFLRLPETHETKYSNLGCVYSLWKQYDKCKTVLERAIREGRLTSEYMQSEPDFDNVRSLPWWQELLREANEKPKIAPPATIDISMLLQDAAATNAPAPPLPVPDDEGEVLSDHD